ncbi:MAG: ABC transporter substrate-binding protein [Candidatus Binatia bacterium]
MNKTLTFLSAVTFYLAGLTGTEAEEASQIPRVGVLVPELQRLESQVVNGLRDGVKELGYHERKSILIEVRNAKGDRTALESMARELLSLKVRLILTTGTRATRVAKEATREIPIVFVHPADPVALGLVNSMAQPGGNTTGVAGLSLQMTEKRMELLKEVVPKLRQIHVFYDANNKFSKENFALAQKAAAKLGLEVAERPIKSVEELKASISGIQKGEGDALFHVPDDLVEGQADFIFEAARKVKLPTMFNEERWVTRGGLAAYGPNYYQMGRQASQLVSKIIKGEKPQNLPVERANKFDLVINLRTANLISLSIPSEVVKRADRVIR